MRPSGGKQIGIDPQRVEILVGRELPGELGHSGGCRMDPAQQGTDRRAVSGIDTPSEQLFLPQPVPCRIKPSHCEQAAHRIVRHWLGRMIRRNPQDEVHIGPFKRVPVGRRIPPRGNFERCEGAFDAELAVTDINPPDIG